MAIKPAQPLWIGAVVAVAIGWWALRGEKHATDTQPPFDPIAVHVNGEERGPIAAATLARVAPDRTFEGWRLWKLRTLLDGEPADGSLVDFERSDGKKAGLVSPPATSGVDVTLAVNPMGRASLILARMAAPMPMPPVLAKGQLPATVTKLEIRRAAPPPERPTPLGVAHGPDAAAAPSPGGGGPGNGVADTTQHEVGAISVALADGASASWSLDDVRRAPSRNDIPTEQGAASAWSLRDVASTLLDRTARVAALTNTKGETIVITPDEWADPARLPVLRVNHRGLWKFDWLDAGTRTPLGRGLRDVSRVSVAR